FPSVCVKQLSAIRGRQQRAFVDQKTARRTGTAALYDWRHSGQFEMPVRAAIFEPAAVHRSTEPVVATLHVVKQPRPCISVIVVICLEDVAEGIDGDLVWIPEVLSDDFESGAVAVHPARDTLVVGIPGSRVRAGALRE